jgi:hypothetical protein
MLTIPPVLLQLREAVAIDMTDEQKPKKRGRPAKVIAQIIEEIPNERLKARITGLCPNPSWARARMEGMSVNIKCPINISKRLLGKEVDVILVKSDPEDYYQYLP